MQKLLIKLNINLPWDIMILLSVIGSTQEQTYVHQKIGLRTHWWTSGKEFTCQCRGHGFYFQSGKISHASGQISLYNNYRACVLEPTHWKYRSPSALEPVLHDERSQSDEKLVHKTKNSLCLPQLEKAFAQEQRPRAAKNK